MECSRHRTISIMSQMSKIILKIFNERLKKMEVTVDNVQFGFSKGSGTRNATLVLRTVNEKVIEKQKDLYVCFVDYEKVFDTVRREQMWEKLPTLGVGQADLRLLINLYWE